MADTPKTTQKFTKKPKLGLLSPLNTNPTLVSPKFEPFSLNLTSKSLSLTIQNRHPCASHRISGLGTVVVVRSDLRLCLGGELCGRLGFVFRVVSKVVSFLGFHGWRIEPRVFDFEAFYRGFWSSGYVCGGMGLVDQRAWPWQGEWAWRVRGVMGGPSGLMVSR